MNTIEFEELIDQTLSTLGDSVEGSYWSRDEIARYLNEGQRDFVRRTQSLRGHSPIMAREDSDTYTLPEDCAEILRVEGTDGTQIQGTTSSQLGASVSDLQAQSGNPQYFYSDLVGSGFLQFWPRPDTDLVATPVQVKSSCLQPAPVQTLDYARAITAGNGKLFVVDDTYLYEFFEESLVRKVAHTISSWGTTTHLKVVANHSLSLQRGKVIILSGASASVINTDDSVVTKVLPVAVDGLAEVHTGSGYFFWSGGGKIYSQDINLVLSSVDEGTYSPILGSVTYSYVSSGIWVHDAYFVSDTGLYRIRDSAITQEIADNNFSGIVFDGATFYIQDATKLKTWTVGGSLSTTSLTSRLVAGLLGYSEGRLWFKDTLFNVVELVGTTETVCYAPYDAGIRDFENAALNGTIYSFFSYSSPVTLIYQMGYLTEECGAIVTIDDIDFDGDEGAVVDISGTLTEVDFNDEYGAVTTIVSAEKLAEIWYIRWPKPGHVEIEEPEALEFYAAYRAYRKDADRVDLMKAEANFRDYKTRVGRANRIAKDNFSRTQSSRTNRYF